MTKSRRRSSASGRRTALPALVAVVVCLLPATLAPAQEVEDITGNIEKYQALVTLASQYLADLDLPEALARYSEVIDGYKAGQLPSSTPLTRQIVGKAYEGRAITYANLGRMDEAEADFEALVQFDVAWPLDRERLSPKILSLYDDIRKGVVGSLAVETEPPGVVVLLNGESIGRSPVFDRELAAGPYKLEVRADGYDPYTEDVIVAGGERLERSVTLSPNARSILLATSPPGATVTVDSQQRGVTFGVAGPEYADVAVRLGVDITEISEPLLVEHLSPGNHLLRIEKECHETQHLSITIDIDPNDNAPVRFEPIRLNPSLGDVTVESNPPGAEVLLDGEPAGRAPTRLDRVCSGRHDLGLRLDGVGQWLGPVDVIKGRTVELRRDLKMTLVFVGMTEPGPGGKPPEGEDALGRALAGLERFNYLGPGSGLPEERLARSRQVAGRELSPQYLSSIASETGADLIVAARPPSGGFQREFEVELHSTRYPSLTRTWSLAPDDRDGIAGLARLLDRRVSLTASWLGVSVIDTWRQPNPVAIHVLPGSPAEAAGVRPGEAVVSLGGKAVATSRDLSRELSALRPSTRASLTLQAPGQAPRKVNLIVGETPVVLPPEGRDLPEPLLAESMSFRARFAAAGGAEKGGRGEADAALLNLAGLLMQSGLPGAALQDALDRIVLPGGPGLSSGTVAYLRGLCLRSLGMEAEARKAFQAAASQEDATLWRNDGPPVAERARRALAGF